jgi:GNAT superfamily N-acetyltransferase
VDEAVLRIATRADIAGMHRVRLAVRENRLTSSAIGEADYVPAIEATGRGWVIDEGGDVRAFAVGNADTGNVWALFVDPLHEGRGFGRRLHDAMVCWLFAQGLPRLTLGTEPGTRAQRFYESAGWRRTGSGERGEVAYELRASDIIRA